MDRLVGKDTFQTHLIFMFETRDKRVCFYPKLMHRFQRFQLILQILKNYYICCINNHQSLK